MLGTDFAKYHGESKLVISFLLAGEIVFWRLLDIARTDIENKQIFYTKCL
jgi:hypothetical protein